MIISKNVFTIFIFILSICISLCSVFFVKTNYLLSFIIFLYFSIVPGFLMLLSLKIKHLDAWKSIVLSFGLSLSILILPTVLFNWIWFLYFKSPPLEKEILLIFYFIISTILLVITYIRNISFSISLKINPIAILKKSYYLLPPIVTVISILGAYQLNNSDTNTFALISFMGVSVLMFISIILHRYLDDNFFSWQVYWYSLSLLLSLSLRSMYVSGWDIQSEYKMFQITNNFGVWNPDNWNHAYNACLSITLLPTIFSKLTEFPDEYIFKFLFQILFAITPVVLFLTFKKYVSSIIAFLAVIYIISQPLFIQPLTALIRQEIAYIFFVLMMFVLFKSQLNAKLQGLFFLIFGFSMVVSHYSTTYITLIVLLLTYPLLGLYRLTEKIPIVEKIYIKFKITSSIKFYRYYLNPILLVILISFTLFWYGFINNQLGQVKQVATDGLSKMNQLFQADITNEESKKAVSFLSQDLTTNEEIENYTRLVLSKIDGDSFRLYPKESYINLDSFPVSVISVSPKFLTQYNKHIVISLEIIKQIFKIAVMFGPFYLFIFYFKKNTFPREYIILSLVSVLIIGIMTFHPSLALNYNLSRFYLQLLFYLSLPAILLMLFIFFQFKKYSISIVGSIVVVLFIYLTGLHYQFFGGEARTNFNNYGSDYDKFYVHKEELVSAAWLRDNIGKRYTLFADQEANLKISRIIDRSINYNVLPALIYKDAYVYGSYANIKKNRTSVYVNGKELSISFPNAFLELNKNAIYSNGGSKIYR